MPLREGKTLWLFGDSFVSTQPAASRRETRMVRNSLALQDCRGKKPVLSFHWDLRTDPSSPFFRLALEAQGHHLWPLAGALLEGKLHLFFNRVRTTDPGSVFGFETTGTVLAVVDNPLVPPAEWQPRYADIPTPKGWVLGSALVAARGWVYLFADGGPPDHPIFLARVRSKSLRAKRIRPRFWTGSSWSGRAPEARALFSQAATEMSVSTNAHLGGYIAVYSEGGVSEWTVFRHAPRPEGPWSEARRLYRCPEMAKNKDYMCYAAKHHPQFDREGGASILITYATNSLKFQDLFEDPALYHPRPVRINLRQAP